MIIKLAEITRNCCDVVLTCFDSGGLFLSQLLIVALHYVGNMTSTRTVPKGEFSELCHNYFNHIFWELQVKDHLTARDMHTILNKDRYASAANKAWVMIYIRNHLCVELGLEELIYIRDPCELWEALKEHFDSLRRRRVCIESFNTWVILDMKTYNSVPAFSLDLVSTTNVLNMLGIDITEEDKIECAILALPADMIVVGGSSKRKTDQEV